MKRNTYTVKDAIRFFCDLLCIFCLFCFVYFFQEKQTPLHLAAQHGQLAVCNLLLELGASLDSTDDYGQKPIHLAAKSNKPEVVKLFLKQRTNLVSVSTKVRSDVFRPDKDKHRVENWKLIDQMDLFCNFA